MPDDVLTLKEVADYLKVTERTIYRMVADRKIPAFKVGGSWRFRHWTSLWAHLNRWQLAGDDGLPACPMFARRI